VLDLVVRVSQPAQGRRVTVYAPEGSYAATRASQELLEAERALAALEQLLEPPRERRLEHVDVFLADTPSQLPAAPPERPAIARVLQPDAPVEPVAASLTRLVVPLWFGPGAAAAVVFQLGIAGVVAGRLEDAEEFVRDELADGRTPSIFGPPHPAVATSFVAFVLDTYGAPALRRFLSEYDPERRDQAALTAYERPLGALEEAWLDSQRERAGTGAAFGALFRHLLPLVRPHWLRWLEVFAYLLYGAFYTVALPLAFRYLFDDVIPSGSSRKLVLFVLVLLAIFTLNALVGMRRAYSTAWVNQRVLFGLQEQMFARLQRLSLGFHGRAKVGDLMSRLSIDLGAVRDAMTTVLTQGTALVLNAVAAAITAIYLDALLGLVVLLVVPLFAMTYVALLSRVQRASYEVQTRFGRTQAEAQENLSAQPVVKAFGLEQRAVASYRSRLDGLFRSLLRLVVLGSLFEASVAMAVTLGQLLVLGLGGYLVIEGRLTLGTLVAFVGLMPTFFQPITTLASVGQTVQKASGAMNRVLEVLEEPVEIEDGPEELPRLERELRLEGVTFAYEEGRPVLHAVDLTIPAGVHVALVGPSGSGKTTVANLVPRFWDSDEGRVAFDGRDVRDVTLESLRGQIAIVFQDTFVFDTTVRENIALARPGATDAEIVEAARGAKLDDYIASLPAGYDTVLGERGVRMSGGQRQRLAIARALLRDPSVLILDEATSALDAQTEREILDTLASVTAGRTTLTITHRLSVAATADRIFVLDAGRVVEQGTHAQLASAGGLYKRLYEEQTGRLGGAAALEAARLRTIPLFAALDADALVAVTDRLSVERFDADEDVVRQGDAGEKLFLVRSGRLDVLVGENGDARRVNELREGDYFGERALLTGEPRSATVRATAPCELYSLARVDFLRLLEREQAVRDVLGGADQSLGFSPFPAAAAGASLDL
jgi:ABC-type multidrug transport system fused ATPase/permease subunit